MQYIRSDAYKLLIFILNVKMTKQLLKQINNYVTNI